MTPTKILKKLHLTPVSLLHYFKLLYRSALLIAAALIYLLQHFYFKPALFMRMLEAMPDFLSRLLTQFFYSGESVTSLLNSMPLVPVIIWIVFTIEMILRFFPSKIESPGSQKQFKKNYIKTGETEIHVADNHSVVLIMLIWIAFNGVFGALKLMGIFDDSIMLILCCCYSVCDMICILFFCPFQTWFMKNKCCSSCRIYNWDYAMMFTPLFFVKGFYSWSLLAMSVILLFRWELTYYFHPERFAENTNEYLTCAHCNEKLCVHKKQLQSVRRQAEEFAKQRIQNLKK